MDRSDQAQQTVEPRALYSDAAVGLGLCAVSFGRVLSGTELGGLTWDVLAVAILAWASLIGRGRWPLVALGLAVACGVVAMPARLDDSPVDVLVGGGLLVATLLRLIRLPVLRRGSIWSGGLRASLGPAWRTPLLGAVAVAAVLVAPVDLKESAAIAILLAAHAVGRTTGRGAVVVAAVASAVLLAVGGTLASPGAWTGPNTPVPLIAVALVGAAVGDAVRSRRELVIASEERTRRMEQALDEEARRRVVEERLRIAREVHDLVAHHIAVVNMQAGVASHLLTDRPEEAAEALRHVRAASRTVLGELGTVLSVLRDADEPTDPAEPAPRMADLDRMLDSFAAAGLRIDPVVSGPPQDLPPTIDLAAYRVIQECLTNAHKHGDGSASLRVSYATDSLTLDIRNPCPAIGGTRPEPGTGHGMSGMRERLVAVGGSLISGPTGHGDFVVSARLPLAPAHGRGGRDTL